MLLVRIYDCRMYRIACFRRFHIDCVSYVDLSLNANIVNWIEKCHWSNVISDYSVAFSMNLWHRSIVVYVLVSLNEDFRCSFVWNCFKSQMIHVKRKTYIKLAFINEQLNFFASVFGNIGPRSICFHLFKSYFLNSNTINTTPLSNR
jgi:hypothetical protein